ncbi:NTF2-like N-terminal transpeptidase domain-containing protein [Nocardia mexicana]|uniref:Cell division protein FtsI/penicillin-binding protein 2 n=1 Tax=Nocardia mexicana TaxID=279262 RepID=A0A370GTH5_9NOCA|nr:NTF2-like N-terminal transpeptidase domain-containing protein [Nocardia mexicana]RDI46801.1 cell division protein FtsI/penicillin-binding protein 2 [Nocardia mexicana]
MDVWGSRRIRVRGAVAVAGAIVLAIVTGSCGLNDKPNSPEAVVKKFTQLLDDKDANGAAQLTSYPNGAEATLSKVFDGLNPGKPDYQLAQYIGLDDNSAMFNLKANWNFGPGKDWTYDLQGSIRKLAIGWRISWEPSVVVPQLNNQRGVKLVRTDAPPPKVNDNAGNTLMTEQVINVVKLDPAKLPDPVASTNALADAIAPVAPLITGPSLMQQLSTSQGKPVVAVQLREDDFAILEPRMAPIPGVVLEKQPRLIVTDRRIWSPMLDGLRKVWQENRDQHAGWGVKLFEADGRPVTQLAGQQGPPGPDVASTLDQKLQRAAEDAVVSAGTPASIVAIQPSTGAVVAAAQNTYATEQGAVAFTGAYPAGGTTELFKQVAAITKKKAPQDVSVQDAAEGAAMLGVGIGFKVPGLDQTTGRLPIGGRGVEQVRQGSADPILASPFGMAIAAAAISRGGVAPPMIEIGRPSTTEAELTPLPDDVLQQLRRMLTDDAAGGPELASLRRYAGVTAYAATAGTSGWLLANMGDLAFAIHIDNADSGDATSRMASRMLQSLAAPDQ